MESLSPEIELMQKIRSYGLACKMAPEETLSRLKSLEDYINTHFTTKPKKLTFNEWLSHRFPAGFENWDGNLSDTDLAVCWKTAQENV